MNVLCPISGLQYSVPHGFGSSIMPHPVFTLPLKKLEQAFVAWDRMSNENKLLLTLAYLNQSGLYDFNVPLKYPSAKALAKLEEAREQLTKVGESMIYYASRVQSCPTFAISAENNTLTAILATFSVWEDWLKAREVSKAAQQEARELEQLENRATFLLNKTINKSKPGKAVASWAIKALQFPEADDIGAYWYDIILAVMNETDTQWFKLADVEELIEHCEVNTMVGSLAYDKLMEALRFYRDDRKDFFAGKGKYSLTEGNDFDSMKEELALKKIKEEAPKEQPKRADYSDSASYVRALLAYNVSSRGK